MIQYLNWLTELEGFEQVDCIENELLIFRYSELIKKIVHKSPFHHDTMRNPHKFDFFAFINHTSGSATIKVDMEEIVLDKPCNLVKLAAGRIFSVERVSPDFDASVMLMSKQFIEGLMVFTLILFGKTLIAIFNPNPELVDIMNYKLYNNKNIKKRYDVGSVSEYDLISSNVSVQNAIPNMIEGEYAVTLALWNLKALLGIDLERDIDVIGSLMDYVSVLDRGQTTQLSSSSICRSRCSSMR